MKFLNLKIRKSTAAVMLTVMTIELVIPATSFALTSGPSQPEMQSFEPVGTTDLVNPFSGDFTYNIPLLDVEGYPVNIAYHSGITAEQEASWVGLGWNINPGNINRGVRGVPDDFNGDKIEKEIEINPELIKKFGTFFSMEIAGVGLDKGLQQVQRLLNVKFGGSVNIGMNISNYTGVSASFGVGSSASVSAGWISAGVNMGATFTTDGGADLDAGASAGFSKGSKDLTGTITGNFGKGYNSREGLRYTSFGVNPSFSTKHIYQGQNEANEKTINGTPDGVSQTMVPISMQNFVPVITNASFMESQFYQFKLGIELPGTVYPNFGGSYGEDKISFEKDGTRAAYGYFNLQNASKDDITDFTRDRDGRFNRDMKYLPSGSMTYDIYSVNGQGTAGNFRSFRNDVGTAYDPYTNSTSKANSNLLEVGVGNIFEAGFDRVNNFTSSSSGPWNDYKNNFTGKKSGSLYEPHFFKQAGELSESNKDYLEAIQFSKPLNTKDIRELKASPLEDPVSNKQNRSARSNLLYYFTGEEASNKCVSLQPSIANYPYPPGGPYAYNVYNISRTAGNRKASQVSEFTQLLPDGKRYIYGIPAMNNKQVEYVVSCGDQVANNNGVIDINTLKPYGGGSGTGSNGQKLFMKSSTPAFAHSYLLSSIISPDYSDLTGDGITDDDLGTYTKFNYTLKNDNYVWRAPYGVHTAQYDKGVQSDCHDDKATFVIGSKEIWMVHSIETKNYIAEFYTSDRDDAKGSADVIGGVGSGVQAPSYKLDSIVLFNRKDRLVNTSAAKSIKKVVFTYDYSLCQGVPNGTSGGGKLTLKAISTKFGNSDIGYLSPYRFTYDATSRPYDPGNKDMWGSYKPLNGNGGLALPNDQFPYVNQDLTVANENAKAWNLTKIKLPSGGSIDVTYEADDYGFVQDRRSMEMFKVEGVGANKKFVAGTALYQNPTNPYLYVYFKRKKNGGSYDELYNDMKRTYLDNADIIQFNFRVKMSSSGETLPSCGIPLDDNIKGYAAVEDVGICEGDADYGYVKLSPKTVDKMPSLKKLDGTNLSLNPVTLSAIFYAKYYNNKALYPQSEILDASNGPALIKQLISSMLELSNYFRSPITKYLNDGRAKYVENDKSFVRLCSQGKKIGGGHRVKRIEFSDNWENVGAQTNAASATYGTEYNYTTVDGASGKVISSGVASYEPIYGGDENPFKEPIATDKLGQKKDFPVVIPTELTVEGPIGESMYPSPGVGYSKVTVTSIHKSVGESAQTIQEHEFYTAKDFPVRTANTSMETLEDKRIKTFDFNPDKREAYRVGQGYSLFFNDMHGKQKKESVKVAMSGGNQQLVSYKSYEYFTNQDGTLNNNVPCVYFDQPDKTQPGQMKQENRVLGIETDLMLDSREKKEQSRTTGFMANLNVFMGAAFPIPIPTAFPKMPKSHEKVFSSIVSTKVIQQYGILKAVETFDKGATVKLSNAFFDPVTGLALITKVNTEHNDYEYQIKYPAYWAYKGMAPAYSNILYDEDITDNARIVNDTFYLNTDHPERFTPGDELLLSLKKSCIQGTNTTPETYKLWVIKTDQDMPEIPSHVNCDCYHPIMATAPVHYYFRTFGHNGMCQNHNHDPMPYGSPNSIPNRDTFDNVCGYSYDSALRSSPTGWNVLNPLLRPATGPSLFPYLQSLLYGPSGTKYPLEILKQEYMYNGDFPANLYGAGYFPSFDIPGMLRKKVYLSHLGSPWGHVDYKGKGMIYRGAVGTDPYAYYLAYPGRPKLNTGRQLIKVTVSFRTDWEFWITSNGTPAVNTKLAEFVHSPSRPHDLNTNNYWGCDYVMYFPYGTNAPNLSSLNVSDMLLSEDAIVDRMNMSQKIQRMDTWIPEPTTLDPYAGRWEYNTTYTPLFPLYYNGNTYNHNLIKSKTYFSSKAELADRASENTGQKSVMALIRRRGTVLTSATGAGKAFPTHDRIYKGNVKIIRSGGRNQLQESIQDISLLSNNPNQMTPFYPNNYSWYVDALTTKARTMTDEAHNSEEIAHRLSDFYNPYVTGMKGNYRFQTEYMRNEKLSYGGPTDASKGILGGLTKSFWTDNNPGQFYNYLVPNPAWAAYKWIANANVEMYSPWGNDLSVKDATGNIQSIIFGYGHKFPVAVVKNAEWNNALYENFEDFGETNNLLNVDHNIIHKTLKAMSSGISFTSTDHHTGTKALSVSSPVVITIPVVNFPPLGFPPKALLPFHFRPSKKYIVSYWQKFDQNAAVNSSFLGALKLGIAGGGGLIKAKTPVIDGWVLFEREVSIPNPLVGGSSINLSIDAGAVIDDLRIIPATSNMKAFVYHPLNHRLIATLDENHMSSFFEYDNEGKLVRIKKETEKGILTLKESRSGLKSILNATTGTIDLKN